MNFDDLESFKSWFLGTRPILVPAHNAVTFYDTVIGLVVYRQPPYQVQLFIGCPNAVVQEHNHPDVDSFEIWLNGMQFSLGGNILVSLEQAAQTQPNGLGMPYGAAVRVPPSAKHGGLGGPRGGAFLSIQKWLHGVEPSCVGSNWIGPDRGPSCVEAEGVVH